MEEYLQLQRGLQDTQKEYEQQHNLVQIQSLVMNSQDEQLVSTVYLQLVNSLANLTQSLQSRVLGLISCTASQIFRRLNNQKQILDVLVTYFNSLDSATRIIAMRAVGHLAEFFPSSFDTFHLLMDALLKTSRDEELDGCLEAVISFVKQNQTHQFAMRVLFKGKQIKDKCGVRVYLQLLEAMDLQSAPDMLHQQYLEEVLSLLSVKPVIQDLTRKLRLAVRVCRLNCSLSVRFFEFCFANMDSLTAVKEIIEEEDIVNQGKDNKERFSKDMFDANSLFIKTTATMTNTNSNSNSKNKTNIVVNNTNTNSANSATNTSNANSAATAAVATTNTTTTTTTPTTTAPTTSQLSDRLREASRSLESFLHKKIKLNENVLTAVMGTSASTTTTTPTPPVVIPAPVVVVPQHSVFLSISHTKQTEENYKQSIRASQVLQAINLILRRSTHLGIRTTSSFTDMILAMQQPGLTTTTGVQVTNGNNNNNNTNNTNNNNTTSQSQNHPEIRFNVISLQEYLLHTRSAKVAMQQSIINNNNISSRLSVFLRMFSKDSLKGSSSASKSTTQNNNNNNSNNNSISNNSNIIIRDKDLIDCTEILLGEGCILEELTASFVDSSFSSLQRLGYALQYQLQDLTQLFKLTKQLITRIYNLIQTIESSNIKNNNNNVNNLDDLNQQDYYSYNLVQLQCLIGLFGGLRTNESLRSDIESLLKDHLLKLLNAAFNQAMKNKLAIEVIQDNQIQQRHKRMLQQDTSMKDKLLSLTVIFSCMLHNKLFNSKTLPQFIENELISSATGSIDRNNNNNNTTTTPGRIIQVIIIIKRTANQLASYGLLTSSSKLLQIIPKDQQSQSFNNTLSLQMQILNVFSQLGKEQQQQLKSGQSSTTKQTKKVSATKSTSNNTNNTIVLQMYDLMLQMISKDNSDYPFHTHFLEFACNYYNIFQKQDNNNSHKNNNNNNNSGIQQVDKQEQLCALRSQLQLLLSPRFNLDSASLSTLRFINTLLSILSIAYQQQQQQEHHHHHHHPQQQQQQYQSAISQQVQALFPSFLKKPSSSQQQNSSSISTTSGYHNQQDQSSHQFFPKQQGNNSQFLQALFANQPSTQNLIRQQLLQSSRSSSIVSYVEYLQQQKIQNYYDKDNQLIETEEDQDKMISSSLSQSSSNSLDYDEDEYDSNPLYDMFIDGRQLFVEQLTGFKDPQHIIDYLSIQQLPLPRALFVLKSQPIIEINLRPMSSHQVRAESGMFIQGSVSLINWDSLQDNDDNQITKINLNLNLTEELNFQQSIYKKINTIHQVLQVRSQENNNSNNNTASRMSNQKKFSKKIKKSSKDNQNNKTTMNAEFSCLIQFPNIGMFAVDISAEVRCSKTGMLLLQKQATIPQRIHAI